MWTWTYEDPPIDRIQFRLSDDGGTTWFPDWTDIPGWSAASSRYVLDGLTNSTDYRFGLRAIRSGRIGNPSYVHGTPQAGLPTNALPTATLSATASGGLTTPGTTPPPVVAPPGGGAAVPRGPSPREADFAWTVQHDIEVLHAGHG